jgi:3-hydroxyisobutyrate dehydrogenase
MNVPMRLANIALSDLTEAMNRGWGNQDSRAIMKLQVERAGVQIEVDPQRIAEALDKKPKA